METLTGAIGALSPDQSIGVEGDVFVNTDTGKTYKKTAAYTWTEIQDPAALAVAAAVSDTAYDATSWNGVDDVAASKNAVRDKLEAALAAGAITEAMLVVPGSVGLNPSRIAVAQYDFATHGGAVGAIVLAATLPIRAVILRSWVEILTSFTSTGNNGTIAFHAQSADDILAAVDADTLSSFVAGVSDGAVANFKKCTAARAITATIGTNAITAGKANVYCEYVVAPS